MPTKFDNSLIQRECKNYSSRIQRIHNEIVAMVVGRQARIISNYNGQCYGHSKKSMKGKVITIKHVLIDSNNCYVSDGTCGQPYLNINEVEFLEG